jgi:hypothetical protein
MTPAQVATHVKHIRSKSSSKYYGKDRINEDIVELYGDLLRAIANNKCQSPANCAQLAIKAEEPDVKADKRPGKKP